MAVQAIPLYQPMIAPGRVVKLDDQRIGIVEFAWAHPYCAGPERCYVVGIEKEFSDWVTREQIVKVYGVVDYNGTASVAAEAATLA